MSKEIEEITQRLEDLETAANVAKLERIALELVITFLLKQLYIIQLYGDTEKEKVDFINMLTSGITRVVTILKDTDLPEESRLQGTVFRLLSQEQKQYITDEVLSIFVNVMDEI